MIADRVLSDLERLWVDLGQSRKGGQGVLRATAMTLIVLTDAGATDQVELAADVAEIMRRHPNRAVVARLNAAGGKLEHQVLADCWRPFQGREQICSERVELDVPAGSAAGLAPVLLALAAADLPVVIWCRDAKLLPVAEELSAVLGARKLVLNSAAAEDAAAALERISASLAPTADLAWTAVTPLREMLAQAFDDASARALLPETREIIVAHPGKTPATPALYLAGWVSSIVPQAAVRFVSRGCAEPACGIELRTGAGVLCAVRPAGKTVQARTSGLESSAVQGALGEAALLAQELTVEGTDHIYRRALAAARAIAAGRA